MATWQYEIYLLPPLTTDQHWDSSTTAIIPDDFDFSSLWKRFTRSEALRTSLSLLLPPATSWTPEIEMWGSENGDRIQIVGHGDVIEEVVVRFDVRSISYKFIRAIVDVANSHELWILTDRMQIIKPDYNGLLKTIKTSSAARFVRDPAAFLEELEKKPS